MTDYGLASYDAAHAATAAFVEADGLVTNDVGFGTSTRASWRCTSTPHGCVPAADTAGDAR
jgi:hypothetical protein